MLKKENFDTTILIQNIVDELSHTHNFSDKKMDDIIYQLENCSLNYKENNIRQRLDWILDDIISCSETESRNKKNELKLSAQRIFDGIFKYIDDDYVR